MRTIRHRGLSATVPHLADVFEYAMDELDRAADVLARRRSGGC